jgi:hypothetical protein
MITGHQVRWPGRAPALPESRGGPPGRRFRGNARRPAHRRRHPGEAERPRIMAAAHRTASCAPRYRRTGLGSGWRAPHPGPASGPAPPYRARRCRCRTAAAGRRSGRPGRTGLRGRRCAGHVPLLPHSAPRQRFAGLRRLSHRAGQRIYHREAGHSPNHLAIGMLCGTRLSWFSLWRQ